MILSDFHMHSEFSSDSETPMEDMIQRAIAIGLKEICFTDHMDYDFPKISVDYNDPNKFLDFQFDADYYCKKIEKLKIQYQDQIIIRTGVELGLQKQIQNDVKNLMEKHKFDFVIGSSHLLYRNDPYQPSFWQEVRQTLGIDTTKESADLDQRVVKYAVRGYFEEILSLIDLFPWFQVYGHLDYIVRYAPGQETYYHVEDYLDVIEAILKKLISSNRGIEINSGGLKNGMHFPNPHPKILTLYRELGGEILTIGADAHKPEFIAHRFDSIRELLLKCGYRYYTTFAEKKPEFHVL